MARNTLETSIEGIRTAWGPLSSEVVAACKRHLEDLLKAPDTEDWLSSLHSEAPASKALHRDPTHGFILLAHAESAGLYRPPHDHGRAWVIYAVQQGEIEMGTYARIEKPDGSAKLVKRNSTPVRPGARPEKGGQRGAPGDAICGAGRRLDVGLRMNAPSDVAVGGLSGSRPLFAIASVLAAMVLVVLDAAVANVALPSIALLPCCARCRRP